MGFSFQSVVGPQKLTDNTYPNSTFRQTSDAALYVQEGHGKFYEQALRGNVYYDNIPVAGIVITGPQAAAGVVCPQVFNPLGAGLVVEFIRLEITYISGNNVPGGFVFYQRGPAAGAATGGLIASLVTPVTPVNANISAIPTKSAGHQFYVGQSTFTTSAPTYLKASRMSMFTGLASTATNPFMLWEEYDGAFIAPNGYLVCFNSAQANGTATFAGTWTVAENSWSQPSS